MFLRSTAVAAALLLPMSLPALSATVTSDTTEVELIEGTIIAETESLSSDTVGLDPTFALIVGAVSAFDPPFELMLDDDDGEILIGGADTFTFSPEGVLEFLFDVTGSATSFFGDQISVSLFLGENVTDPFADDIDFLEEVRMVIDGSPDIGGNDDNGTPVSPVPLPASLPLLGGLLLGGAVIARRRRKS